MNVINLPIPSGRTRPLGFTQLLAEMNSKDMNENFSEELSGPMRKANNPQLLNIVLKRTAVESLNADVKKEMWSFLRDLTFSSWYNFVHILRTGFEVLRLFIYIYIYIYVFHRPCFGLNNHHEVYDLVLANCYTVVTELYLHRTSNIRGIEVE
jgi:hypothetical protein